MRIQKASEAETTLPDLGASPRLNRPGRMMSAVTECGVST